MIVGKGFIHCPYSNANGHLLPHLGENRILWRYVTTAATIEVCNLWRNLLQHPAIRPGIVVIDIYILL